MTAAEALKRLRELAACDCHVGTGLEPIVRALDAGELVLLDSAELARQLDRANLDGFSQ